MSVGVLPSPVISFTLTRCSRRLAYTVYGKNSGIHGAILILVLIHCKTNAHVFHVCQRADGLVLLIRRTNQFQAFLGRSAVNLLVHKGSLIKMYCYSVLKQ